MSSTCKGASRPRLLIVSGGSLPVPASRGGAVETLIDLLAEENEKEAAFELEIVSRSPGSRRREGKPGRHTTYRYIRYPVWVRLLDALCFLYQDRMRGDWRGMFTRNARKNSYYARKLAQRLPLGEYDAVVVENNMSLLEAIAGALGEDFSKKCIYHMHSVLVDNPAMIPYLSRCRKLIAVSDYVRQELYRSVPEFAGLRIEKVTNGVKQAPVTKEQRREEQQRMRRRFRIGEEETVFLYCGRISPEKGVLECVQAYAACARAHTRLLIVGSAVPGSDESSYYVREVRCLADRYPGQIVMTGYVPYEEIAGYYRMADALVVPSVVGDAAPLTVLEGMAEGVFLIASKVGGIPEYTDRYPHKRLVEPGEGFAKRLSEAMDAFCGEHPAKGADAFGRGGLPYSPQRCFAEFRAAVSEE